MTTEIYRYRFEENVSAEDIESALLLALWGCEALHGEVQTRLDASHYFAPDEHTCVIDTGTPAGKDFNRLFIGFMRREIGEDAFQVDRVTEPSSQVAA